MVKSLERGQKFLVPLPDGSFAPGYIVHQGNLFTLVNVYSNTQPNRTEPTHFPDDDILVRDWLIGDHVFSKSKKVIEVPWVLFRTKFVKDPDPPRLEGILIGERGREKVADIMTGKVVRAEASPDDLDRLPKHGIKIASYYSLSVQAKLAGKDVVLDTDTRKYVIR